MFTSQYDHKIDAKCRMFLPTEYRDIIGNAVYLGKGTDCNLYLMTVEEWEAYKDELLKTLSYTSDVDIFRHFFGNTVKVSVDSQGRILIPAKYMEYAKLSSRATIVGCGIKAEIWNPDLWQAYLDGVDISELTRKMAENKL